MQPLAHEAVHAALACDWTKAIELNKKILKEDKHDIDALLRLATALLQTGDTKHAEKYAKQAQAIDDSSPLVKKCLERCKSNTFVPGEPSVHKVSLKAFLEHPGKTHMVRLVHLGEPKTIAKLHPGETLKVAVNSHKVSVETDDGAHIGHLPDDIVAKIANMKKAQFWAAVKYVRPSEVSVILHER